MNILPLIDYIGYKSDADKGFIYIIGAVVGLVLWFFIIKYPKMRAESKPQREWEKQQKEKEQQKLLAKQKKEEKEKEKKLLLSKIPFGDNLLNINEYQITALKNTVKYILNKSKESKVYDSDVRKSQGFTERDCKIILEILENVGIIEKEHIYIIAKLTQEESFKIIDYVGQNSDNLIRRVNDYYSEEYSKIKSVYEKENDNLRKLFLEGLILHNEESKNSFIKNIYKYVDITNTEEYVQRIKELQQNDFLKTFTPSMGVIFNYKLSIDTEMDQKQKDAFERIIKNTFTSSFILKKGKVALTNLLYSSLFKDCFSTYVHSHCFNYIESNHGYSIPTFELHDNEKLYIYPNFAIKAKSKLDFDILSLDAIKFIFNTQQIIYDMPGDLAFRDAKFTGYVYEKMNQNGTPDMRYKNNTSYATYEFGVLTIQPFGVKYYLHNQNEAKDFEYAYNKYIKTLKSINKDNNYLNLDKQKEDNNNKEQNIFNSKNVNIKYLDPQIEEAINIVISNEIASTSIIQRKLSIGYNRAARIMDQMESLGIVGPQIGSNPRSILIQDLSEIETIIASYNTISQNVFNVQESYFTNIFHAVIQLMNFYETLEKDSSFITVLDKHTQGGGGTSKERLWMYSYADIKRIYENLNHSTDNLENKEGFSIILLVTMMSQPDINISYQTINFLKEMIPSVENAMDSLDEILNKNPDKDTLFIPFFLDEIKRSDLKLKYFTLLYRFFSIVAKADNIITEEESKQLNKLLKKTNEKAKPTIISSVNNSQNKSNLQNNINEKEFNTNSIDKLNELIGLKNVKNEIQNLSNLVKIQRMKEKRGMKISNISYHCVFTGNPGTGKTSVARIVAEIYKELGVLKQGHLIETDRSGLVAEYVGQTAPKTNAIIDSALDGVLFIDEAYSLIQGGDNDYGKEAIATLLKRMEDDRERLVVILAGYSKEMKQFIDSNSGLQSRFNRYIEFPDYTSEELYQIFEYIVKQNDCSLTEDAKNRIKDYIEITVNKKDNNFGNARFVRNLFEKILTQQANRLTLESNITNEMLSLITEEDVVKSI